MCEDFDQDFTQCPRCCGWGAVDCHCGGDLCCCTNYGYAPCPLCHGDGEVSEGTYQRYMAAQAENARLFEGVRAKIATEREAEND